MRITPGLLAVEDFEEALACESFTTRGLVPADVEMWALFNHAGADKPSAAFPPAGFVMYPGQLDR